VKKEYLIDKSILEVENEELGNNGQRAVCLSEGLGIARVENLKRRLT
jgi:hypothetical protein